PFTFEEVQTLLAQGIVRFNDLAYRLDSADSDGSWKFLWQFEEFERRKEQRDFEAPADRRKNSTEHLHRERTESLPIDIQNIEPHDLLLKSKRDLPAVSEPEEAPAANIESFRVPAKPLAIGISLCLVGGLAMYFLSDR